MISKKGVALVACAAAVAAAGCGSSKKSSSSSSSSASTANSSRAPITVTSPPATPLPKAKERLGVFDKHLTAVFADAASGNCPPVKAFATSAAYSLPCTPGKPQPQFAGFKVTGAAHYGMGAVVEFTDAEVAKPRHNLDIRGATPATRKPTGFLALALGPNGTYTYIPATAAPIFAGSFIGTQPSGWPGADAAAVKYLTAVRASDCPTWFKYSAIPNGISQAQACKLGLAQAEAPLRKALRTQPVKLSRMAGNAVFYFYRVQIGGTVGTLGITRDQPPAPPFKSLGTVRAPSR